MSGVVDCTRQRGPKARVVKSYTPLEIEVMRSRVRRHGLPRVVNACPTTSVIPCPKCSNGMQYEEYSHAHHCIMCGTMVHYDLPNRLVKCKLCGRLHMAITRNNTICGKCQQTKEEKEQW